MQIFSKLESRFADKQIFLVLSNKYIVSKRSSFFTLFERYFTLYSAILIPAVLQIANILFVVGPIESYDSSVNETENNSEL